MTDSDKAWYHKCYWCERQREVSAYSENQLKKLDEASCNTCVLKYYQCQSCKKDFRFSQIKKYKTRAICKPCMEAIFQQIAQIKKQSRNSAQFNSLVEKKTNSENNQFSSTLSVSSNEFDINDEISSDEDTRIYSEVHEVNFQADSNDRSNHCIEHSIKYDHTESSDNSSFEEIRSSSSEASRLTCVEKDNDYSRDSQKLYDDSSSNSSSNLWKLEVGDDISESNEFCIEINNQNTVNVGCTHRCSLCREEKDTHDFSGNQLRKKELAKCRLCVVNFLSNKTQSQIVNANENSHRKCFSCNQYKKHDEFSRQQREKKKNLARCIHCITNMQRCSNCQRMKTRNEFSSTQLRKSKELRTCRLCVAKMQEN